MIVHADSISVGGGITDFVSTNGGRITGTALLLYNITGDIHSGAGG